MRRIYFIAIALILVGSAFLLGAKAGEVYPLDQLLSLPEQLLSQEEAPQESLEQVEEEIIEEEPEPEPDIRSLRLMAVGNIFPHLPQITQADLGDGRYDFSPSFEVIAPLLHSADLVVADLETAQAGPDISYLGVSGYTGFPMFNSPQELTVALRDAGVDILTLGNNHALDRGYDGLMATIDHLHGLGFKTFGAYQSPEERDRPLIVDHNGLKIAFIGYTFSTNGLPMPENHPYILNYAPGFQDLEPIIADIDLARNSGVDIIAVFPHWGENEYASEPQPQYYREVAATLTSAGADLIIGGHPKFVQPFEWFFNDDLDGRERASLAIYSQGTFLSNQHYPANISPLVEYSLILEVELTKNMDSGQAWLSAVDYEITWIHREWRHRILPLSDVFNGDPADFNVSEVKLEDLKNWQQRNIETAEAYGHLEDLQRAMAIAELNRLAAFNR